MGMRSFVRTAALSTAIGSGVIGPSMAELNAADEMLGLLEEAAALKEICPAFGYVPHEDGQRQFHEATQPIRALFPGNGFGKSFAMMAEVDAWARHTNRWQRTPDWPVVMIWYAKDEDQWDLLRPDFEAELLGVIPKYSAAERKYTWPDGSFLKIILADNEKSWEKKQGSNPDLVIFDEKSKVKLWREMLMRRRGKRATKFILGATATTGMSWMFTEVYKPWREYHRERGISVDRARFENTHPDMWVWDHGGIDSNPAASESDRRWYHDRTWSSPKEKKVRLYGGFEDWVGDPVFDADALERMNTIADELNRRSPGKVGRIVLN